MTRRRLLKVLTVLSLLLCVASAALWVRSYWRQDSVTWTGAHPSGFVGHGERWVGVEWGEGVACLVISRPEAGMRARAGRWQVYSSDDPRRGFSSRRRVLRRRGNPETLWRMGFGPWGTDVYDRNGSFLFGSRSYGVPLWFVCVVAAVAPAVALGRHMGTRSRRVGGRCPSCGYNLTGNVSGVCPECGIPVGAEAA